MNEGKTAYAGQFGFLSNPDPSWLQVAAKQQSLEKVADEFFNLPMSELRKVVYRPPLLPANAPIIGKDILVDQIEIAVRDGTKIGVRVYRPKDYGSNHLLFFNVHGGGWNDFGRHVIGTT